MFFGIPFGSLVFVHTIITLVAIVTGLLVLFGLLRSDRMNGMTAIFLLFTVLTDISGFVIQIKPVTPAVTLGVVLAAVLIPTLAARYLFAMRGMWRWIYVVGATLSLYLNVFVLVVQAFLKVPPLHAIVPAVPPAGPVFGATQGVVLILFIIAGYLGVRRFHPKG
ncbi:MAG: hypothetical protein ISS15_14830 [Alphaproteobacteria bacterium]|nr:hypothetical protein [Alphaproteobacteria bacterium]MBL6937592.1 hypothetical protein [Alphaproteobacteria bacterium]MBL7098930.1 hypothetical protein [Alphaproteobacteria bacterium]